MNTVSGGTRPWTAVVGVVGLLAIGTVGGVLASRTHAAEDPPATSYIESTPDRQCDEFNRSWSVLNQHTYLSIKVSIRWHAVGAREMQEEFILPPRGVRAIGCARNVEVISAEILQF